VALDGHSLGGVETAWTNTTINWIKFLTNSFHISIIIINSTYQTNNNLMTIKVSNPKRMTARPMYRRLRDVLDSMNDDILRWKEDKIKKLNWSTIVGSKKAFFFSSLRHLLLSFLYCFFCSTLLYLLSRYWRPWEAQNWSNDCKRNECVICYALTPNIHLMTIHCKW